MAAAALLAISGSASAESLKIGLLTSLTGPISVLGGDSNIAATKMAIDDAGGSVLGRPIELLVSDTQNKPDVALAIAREWIDTKDVTAIFDVNHSAAALAVAGLTEEMGVNFLSEAGATALTNENCADTHTQWLVDSYALIQALVTPLVRAGNDDWFFIAVDYAFGHDAEAKGIEAVKKAGGRVVGSVRHSPQATDFSAYLLEAQAKGAKTIVLATFGAFQTAIIKQVKEFNMNVKLAPLYLGITDIKAIGMENLIDVSATASFYWDRNEKTRAFSERFLKYYNRPPTFLNAEAYQATTHYLKAVEAAGTTDAKAVAAKMRELKVEDATDVSAYVREDGRVMRDMYALTVKPLGESTGEWDMLKVTDVADKEDINLPLSQSTCKLVKK